MLSGTQNYGGALWPLPRRTDIPEGTHTLDGLSVRLLYALSFSLSLSTYACLFSVSSLSGSAYHFSFVPQLQTHPSLFTFACHFFFFAKREPVLYQSPSNPRPFPVPYPHTPSRRLKKEERHKGRNFPRTPGLCRCHGVQGVGIAGHPHRRALPQRKQPNNNQKGWPTPNAGGGG